MSVTPRLPIPRSFPSGASSWSIDRPSGRLWVGCLLGCCLAGCPSPRDESRPSGAGAPGPSSLAPLASALSTSNANAAPSTEAPPERTTEATPEKPDGTTPPGPARFLLGELADIGPAAPARAASDGVYVATKDDELLFARYDGSTFESFDAPPEQFSRYGRAPSLSATHAYWVSPRGALLRGNRKTLVVDELDRGAHSGTRTSVATLEGRDVVAYVKDDGGEAPRAYVYAGPDNVLRLSEDAATATSVTALVLGKKIHVFSLEGRIGLSSVHRRTLEWHRGKLRTSPDEVPWVGPGSHPLTEVGSLGNKSPFAFLAMSRDASHFGLVQLPLDDSGAVAGEPYWLGYPNGIDPAPVAAETFCGAAQLVYARPSSPKPRSPQELRVTLYDRKEESVGDVLATSRAFNDVSIAARPRGAIVSWTADHRTWAIALGCPK